MRWPHRSARRRSSFTRHIRCRARLSWASRVTGCTTEPPPARPRWRPAALFVGSRLRRPEESSRRCGALQCGTARRAAPCRKGRERDLRWSTASHDGTRAEPPPRWRRRSIPRARTRVRWRSPPAGSTTPAAGGTRWVSSNCRTMRRPVRAVERQCTARRSSPGTYSRRAWNDTSDDDRFCVVMPSTSRRSPMAPGATATVRGWTKSSCRWVRSLERRSNPTGSSHHSAYRPDRDHAAPASGDGEDLLVLVLVAQAADAERRDAASDRQLDLLRTDALAGPTAHDDLPEALLTHLDAAALQAQRRGVVVAAEHEGDREQCDATHHQAQAPELNQREPADPLTPSTTKAASGVQPSGVTRRTPGSARNSRTRPRHHRPTVDRGRHLLADASRLSPLVNRPRRPGEARRADAGLVASGSPKARGTRRRGGVRSGAGGVVIRSRGPEPRHARGRGR